MKIDDKIINALDAADEQALEALLCGIETKAGALRKARIGRAAKAKAGLDKGQARSSARISRAVRFAAAAAALVFVIGAALGVTAYAKEYREYKEAMSFFNECELPTDGLSKGAVREAYQSITRGRASGEARGSIIGLGQYRIDVSAMETGLSPAPYADLASLWSKSLLEGIPESGDEYKVDCRRGLLALYGEGTHYVMSTEPESEDGFGFASVAEYERGEQIWQLGYSPAKMDAFGRFGSSVVMVGRTIVPDGSMSAFIAVRNDDSEEIHNIGAVPASREFFSIVQNGGIYAIFSHDAETGKTYMLRFNRYFAAVSETELDCPEGYSVVSTASFGEGYALLLRDTVSDTGDTETDIPRYMIAITDRNGKSIKAYFPSLHDIAKDALAAGNADNANPEDCRFYAADIIEYRGKLCVSGCALAGGSELGDVTEGEYTSLIKAECTAMLIELDPDDETQAVLCLEAGALGNALRTDDSGMLVWNVCGIREAKLFEKDGGSHTEVSTAVYEIRFTAKGAVIAADTGARAAFAW